MTMNLTKREFIGLAVLTFAAGAFCMEGDAADRGKLSIRFLGTGAAELAQRWSFNGDYSDSVGGADAVKCGTYVSLYGGMVHMGYGACSHGTGYVDLGTNMLDTTAATIEIWARHDGVSFLGDSARFCPREVLQKNMYIGGYRTLKAEFLNTISRLGFAVACSAT